jgi:hypothetical protein
MLIYKAKQCKLIFLVKENVHILEDGASGEY